MSDRTSWRREIEREMARHGESFAAVDSTTLTTDDLDREFDGGFGSPKGVPFTVWTAARVYFPACYDGAEWCESVARNPDGKATDHIGG